MAAENSLTTASTRTTLRDILRTLRTRQWAKNVLLFAGWIFAGRLRAPAPELWYEATRVALAFICFCMLSASAYIINDWHDIERDRQHPIKKNRPLASGRISVRTAGTLLASCLLIALLSGSGIVFIEGGARGFVWAAGGYFVLTLLYSFVLKNIVIVDVLSIAAGFVSRVVAGCLAIPVVISPWIIFCTFTGALFIALCKRRAELLEMGEEAQRTRGVLEGYNISMLDTFIAVASGLTITAYSLYTFSATRSTALSPALHNTPLLMATIPFVVYGVFRYLLLAHSTPVGGEPEHMLRDKPFMVNVMVWIALVAILTSLG
jgi:4-hydroxybenzoate polyprenyltransferase